MAVKDIASNLLGALNAAFAIVANGLSTGLGVDNANGELGLMFGVYATAWTDGTYVLGAQESDDNSTWTTVAANKIIGSGTISAAMVAGNPMKKIGVFSNKRYVRPTITATLVTVGANITAVSIQNSEYQPV